MHAGSTNLISNWTRILQFSSAEVLVEIVKHACLPKSTLPTFLHEYTHHWTFLSPLGEVLSFLYLRARRNAVLACYEEDTWVANQDECDRFLEDLVRFKVASAMLRPLSEGLALFSEHDLCSGATGLASETARASYDLYCPLSNAAEDVGNGEPFRSFNLLVAETRLSHLCEQRKLDLLSQPLRYSSSSPIAAVQGGYLPGYLCLKNIRIALIAAGCRDALDNDFFLCLVRSFLFEDYGLVAQILKPIDSRAKFLTDLALYVENRLHRLAKLSPSVLADFGSWALRNEKERPASPLCDVDSLEREGRQALIDLMMELKSSGSTRRDHLVFLDGVSLVQRHLACIASFSEMVTIGEHFVSIERPDGTGVFKPILMLPVLPGIPPGREHGRIECFISGAQNIFSIVVSVDGKTISCSHLHDTDAEQKRVFSLYQFDIARAERRDEVCNQAVETVARCLGIDVQLGRLLELAEGVTERVLCAGALMHVARESRERVESLMAEHGLYTLLDGDYQQLEALSAVSVACSLWPHLNVSAVDAHLSTRGHSLDEVSVRCDEVAGSTGFPLLVPVDDFFLSFV